MQHLWCKFLLDGADYLYPPQVSSTCPNSVDLFSRFQSDVCHLHLYMGLLSFSFTHVSLHDLLHPTCSLSPSLFFPLSVTLLYSVCRILCLAIIYTYPAAPVHPSILFHFPLHLLVSHLQIEPPIICTIPSIHPSSHTCSRTRSASSDTCSHSQPIFSLNELF